MNQQNKPLEKGTELSRKQVKEMMPGYYIPPKKREPSLKGTETNVQNAICKYLKLKGVMFISDSAAGMVLSKGMVNRMKTNRSNHSFPDIFICEPCGNFHGLFIEVKRSYEDLYNLNGSFKKSDHIDAQIECLVQLRKRGYRAEFACGFDECKKIVNNYFGW